MSSTEGDLSYRKVYDYNELLMETVDVLKKKNDDLVSPHIHTWLYLPAENYPNQEKKRKMLYSMATRLDGKRYDQKIRELQRVMTLIENVHKDGDVLNRHISEFKSSSAYAHTLQVIEEDLDLLPAGTTPTGRQAVISQRKQRPEDIMSFEDMLAREKEVVDPEQQEQLEEEEIPGVLLKGSETTFAKARAKQMQQLQAALPNWKITVETVTEDDEGSMEELCIEEDATDIDTNPATLTSATEAVAEAVAVAKDDCDVHCDIDDA